MEQEAVKEESVGDDEVTEAAATSSFEEIYKYKFRDNVKFVQGWRKVKDVIAKEKLYDSLIKAQVYFFSREVGPVDLDGYKNWLRENDKEIEEFDALMLDDVAIKDNQTNVEEVVNQVSYQKEKSIISASEADSVENKSEEFSEQSDNVGKHPTNFIELIEMIQSGMKLPDTENLNIEPLNEDPTPCDMQRPKKPWEVS